MLEYHYLLAQKEDIDYQLLYISGNISKQDISDFLFSKYDLDFDVATINLKILAACGFLLNSYLLENHIWGSVDLVDIKIYDQDLTSATGSITGYRYIEDYQPIDVILTFSSQIYKNVWNITLLGSLPVKT